MQKEQAGHIEDIQKFIEDIKAVKQRLTAARVRTRLYPILMRLAINNVLHDPIYPTLLHVPGEVVGEDILPRRPPTPFPHHPAPSTPSQR